jgi:dolichol-phosphate mannosyltransferase
MVQLRALVVIPTYNEAENVARAIATVLETVPTASVLVVDDASPDGTGDLVDDIAKTDRRVAILHRSGREGLGQAYLAGFRQALDRGGRPGGEYDAIIEMDADGSHPASALPAMLAALETHDLVIGSRWIAGGSVANWPRHREWLSRAANTYTRIALRIPVRDSTAGFRAFRPDTLRRIDLDHVDSRGYCFQIDMTLRVLDAGLSVAEVPITFIDRVAGYSKMSGSIVVEAMLRVTGWGIQRLFRRRTPVSPVPDEAGEIVQG